MVDQPTSRTCVAGVELGGTKCVCIVGDGPDNVLAEARVETGEPARTLAAIKHVLTDWRSRHHYAALGVASFGPLQLNHQVPDFGTLMTTPKPGWSGINLLAELSQFGEPTRLDTDVNAAALAEQKWGNAQGLSSFAYVTVGTGVGVGTFVAGAPVSGLCHSEAGHMRVPRLSGDNWPGSCPYHGDCVEGLASGVAIRARTGHSADALQPGTLAWRSVAHALAQMVHNLVLTAGLERVIMGGGVMLHRPDLIREVKERLVESLAGYSACTSIAQDPLYLVAPGLGERAGPLGSLALGLQALAERR